jgi:acyl-CoA dehydrogenase
VEEFASARLLRDAHLGSIWEGTTNIVALDALTRAVGRHGAESALASELHARLDDAKAVPEAFRDSLHATVDRAIAFARAVARDGGLEGDARRATSALYHAASAVLLAWEGERIHHHRGDARRLLLARLVFDHRLTARDPFTPDAGAVEAQATTLLLGERPVTLAEAAAVVTAQ